MWLAKIVSKLVLSRIPFGYSIWRRLGLFRHGSMDAGSYALSVFDRHHSKCSSSHSKQREDGYVCLELGPGDSVASALLARCRGAARTYLVDAGAFATTDIAVYSALADGCRREGIAVPPNIDFRTFDAFLRSCRASYLTDGLRSLSQIPTCSVDFIWSQAVLEHIPAGEFSATISELHRILAPGGICSHRIDLKDHLSGALNNLRFSQRTWESPLFRNSGFYTNRIRYGQMVEVFEKAGFEVRIQQVDRWDRLPTPRSALTEPFCSMSPDELRVSGFDVLLLKRQDEAAVA